MQKFNKLVSRLECYLENVYLEMKYEAKYLNVQFKLKWNVPDTATRYNTKY